MILYSTVLESDPAQSLLPDNRLFLQQIHSCKVKSIAVLVPVKHGFETCGILINKINRLKLKPEGYIDTVLF